MADLLSELASKAGLKSEQAGQGLGALLESLKERLSPEAFAHLKGAIPGSEGFLDSAREKAQSGGAGLVESLKNAAGKIFGGGTEDPAAPAGPTGGMSVDQLKSLLPRLHDMLASKLPAHVVEQIQEHLPGFKPSDEEAVSTKA